MVGTALCAFAHPAPPLTVIAIKEAGNEGGLYAF